MHVYFERGARASRWPALRWCVRTRMGRAALLSLCGLWALFTGSARAAQWDARLDTLGQVRDGDLSSRTESPVNLYGSLAGEGMHHGLGGETYFRIERDWSRAQTTSDFYLGRAEAAFAGLQFSLGRQTLEDLGAGFLVADAGRLTFDRGTGWAVSIFGGQPRYFEPQPRIGAVSRDEQLFGASARYRLGLSSSFGIGFLQLQREAHRIQQLAQMQFRHDFRSAPGRPDVYALAAYDTAEQALERVHLGALLLLHTRFFARLETSYYKPQARSGDGLTGLERYSDPIFSLFSASSLGQVRGGLQYFYRRNVSAYADYSAQEYETLPGNRVTGHLGSVGLLWLPGGDGLETVRAEYAVIDGPGGRVHHWRLYHENQAYQRLLVRTKFDVAAFDKSTNREDLAASARFGIGYLLRPGLLAEVNLEVNHNPRFDEEIRAGVFLTYRWRYQPAFGWMELPAATGRLPGGWAG